MLKILGKDEEIFSYDIMYKFYAAMYFYSSQDYQEFNMAKSKLIFMKIARK